ncbi:hypothetical protein [Mycolicibacterium fallax]|uniref:Uncharacterized protein n=1 Tax=Mycolicibacterium fallax TaxID=1793 RepID=A0A1X1R017_MYCFA|nr:hypothetical protein [Mycolicibacterium fallax]ORU97244.1 hypothetical protein AWC04_18345 [Mycolicibacterium fallax]BBY97864.1 hypothetical protein MFAL_13310 [Mycolicibacterium fallax]
MSARAAAAAVADHAIANEMPLPWVTVYAAEAYLLLGCEPPLAHGPAIAMARREIGVEGETQVLAWLADHRDWITAAGAALTALDDLETDPIPDTPREAALIGAAAERAALAAGAPLAEVIWHGTCATAQAQARFWGIEPGITRICGADPIAGAAARWAALPNARLIEIANAVHQRLREFAAAAEAAEADKAAAEEAGR